MLPELMREDGGVKPVERQVATIDHVDQRIEHPGLLPDLVPKAEVLLSFDQTECSHDGHVSLALLACQLSVVSGQ